jgi:ATP-dependent HslUV protease subunit HslV
MTTVVVVKKGGQVTIAADTLVTFGDTPLSHRFERISKIFRVEDAGGASLHRHGRYAVAHFPGAAACAGRAMPRELRLFGSKHEIFETFSQVARGAERQRFHADQGRRQ